MQKARVPILVAIVIAIGFFLLMQRKYAQNRAYARVEFGILRAIQAQEGGELEKDRDGDDYLEIELRPEVTVVIKNIVNVSGQGRSGEPWGIHFSTRIRERERDVPAVSLVGPSRFGDSGEPLPVPPDAQRDEPFFLEAEEEIPETLRAFLTREADLLRELSYTFDERPRLFLVQRRNKSVYLRLFYPFRALAGGEGIEDEGFALRLEGLNRAFLKLSERFASFVLGASPAS